MTASDALHLAFGAAAGVTLIAMFLFASQSIQARGAIHAIGSLVACLLALVLLIGAAAQLDPVLRGLKPAPKASAGTKASGKAKTGRLAPTAKAAPAEVESGSAFAIPELEPKKMLSALLQFASSLAFLAALVGGVAAALLAWVTRDDSSDEEAGEAEPLADGAAEPAL